MAITNLGPTVDYEGDVGDVNPMNKVVYVAVSGGDDNASGEDPNVPLATLLQGITNAAAGGTIILGPGTHSVDVSLGTLKPLANQTITGACPSYGGYPNSLITGVGDDAVMVVIVDVDGVVFRNLTFFQLAGTSTLTTAVALGEGAAIDGATFSNCYFDFNQVNDATIGISCVDGTNAVKHLSVLDCHFVEMDETAGGQNGIRIGPKGAPGLYVKGCTFNLAAADASARGVYFEDPAGSVTSYGAAIVDNDFIGPFDAAADMVGIELASAAEDTEFVGIMARNYFAAGAANPITKDQGSAHQMGNLRADASGGAVTFDSST